MSKDDLTIGEVKGARGGEAAASQYAAMLGQMQQAPPAQGGFQEGGGVEAVGGVNTQDSTSFSPEAAAAAQGGPEAEGENTSSLIAGLSETFDSQNDPDSNDHSEAAGGIAGSEAAAAAGKIAQPGEVNTADQAEPTEAVNAADSSSEQQNLGGAAQAQVVPGVTDAHAGLQSQKL